MTFTGDASQEDEGTSTIDVTRAGETTTRHLRIHDLGRRPTFTGQLVCATT